MWQRLDLETPPGGFGLRRIQQQSVSGVPSMDIVSALLNCSEVGVSGWESGVQ